MEDEKRMDASLTGSTVLCFTCCTLPDASSFTRSSEPMSLDPYASKPSIGAPTRRSAMAVPCEARTAARLTPRPTGPDDEGMPGDAVEMVLFSDTPSASSTSTRYTLP